MALRRFSLSSGSACSSGSREPSNVLSAIGLDYEQALGTIRFGLGRDTTVDHISLLIEDVTKSVARLREISV